MNVINLIRQQADDLQLLLVKALVLLVSIAVLVGGVRVMGFENPDPVVLKTEQPALGLSSVFGRWSSTVKLIYDPDNAPPAFSDTATMLRHLEEASSAWERVSGIQIEILGADAAAREDESRPISERDGLVRVHWEDLGPYAGRAGGDHGPYNDELGYRAFADGEVILSNDAAMWKSDRELINTLMHEFGHLLGLGHSDNPSSLMYANPYNFLAYPRQDDIQAAQTMYGPPASGLDPAAKVPEWTYQVPPQAASISTKFLFKPNQYDFDEAQFSLSGNPVAAIDINSPDDSYLRVHSGGIGNFSNPVALNINATIVLVDPGGYVYSRLPWKLQCQIGYACGKGYENLMSTRVIKSTPGIWRLYVVAPSQGTGQDETLLQLNLPVFTGAVRNQAPQAEVTVNAIDGPAQVRVQLKVTDPEGSDVDVIWHAPGQLRVNADVLAQQQVHNGGVATNTINFSRTGTHTLFVELRDKGSRYDTSISGSGGAGRGFQTLLRLTVTLPLASSDSVVLHSSRSVGDQSISTNSIGTSSQAITLELSKPSATNRDAQAVRNSGSSSARFWMQASLQQGNVNLTGLHSGDQVQISGVVNPQVQDIDKAADIFIVIRSNDALGEHWSFRAESGSYLPWNGQLSVLEPAMTVAHLQGEQAVEIFDGALQKANHRVFIGYRLLNADMLHYTGEPLQLAVNDN